ncbi:MAG: MFS transporter [Chloroflexia bacterium]
MAEAVLETGEKTGGASFREVLHNRPFLFLWMAQLLSQLATQIINYAVFFQVSQLTDASATASAGIIICFTAPAVLFSAMAGVLVEHKSKKFTLVVTNVVRGVSVLFYVATVALPKLDVAFGLPILFINTFVFSSVTQFFAPAEAAMIPLLVKRKQLVAANSLFNLTLTASQLIGFIFLGPVLVSLISYKWLYVGLFGLFVVCAGLAWRLPDPEAARISEESARQADARDGWLYSARVAWVEFKEGLAFIRSSPALIIAIVYWSVAISVLFMLATIGPRFLKTVLNLSADNLYFILVPGGIGLVIGVVLVGRFGTEHNRGRMINYGLLAAGACLLGLALIKPVLDFAAQLINQPPPPTIISQAVIGAMAFLLGMCNSLISVPSQTVLQEQTPEDIRARVFGAFYTVSNIFLIIPLVIVGAVADLIGVLPTVVGIAALIVLIAGVGLRYQRQHKGLLTAHIPSAEAGAPSPGSEPEFEQTRS